MPQDAMIQFSLPAHPDGSTNARSAVLAELHRQHALQLTKFLNANVRAIVQLDAFQKALVRLGGGEANYQRARRYLVQERRRAYQPERIREGNLAHHPSDETARRDVLARRLDNLDVDPIALSRLRKKCRLLYSKRDPIQSRPRLEPPTRTVKIRALRSSNLLGWTTRNPPYDGWHYSWSWETVNTFHASFWQNLVPSTGQITNSVVLRNSDHNPSDSDYGTITMQTALGFWFFTTRSSRIEAQVELSPPSGLSGVVHSILFDDQSGWSRGDAYQKASIFMSINGMQVTTKLTSRKITDRDDGFWKNYHYQDWKGPFWFHFLSDQSWPANIWVWVEVGHRNYSNALMNDVTCDSHLSSHWNLKCVQIRST